MVKIRWKITDIIERVELKEFNIEWDGIYGYFELCINNQVLGFCPDRELLADEKGNEDILYWLSKLSNGMLRLNAGEEYQIQLLSMNLTKIMLKKNDMLLVSFVNCDTDEIIWSEEIMFEEWCQEVMRNIDGFIAEIQKMNAILLESDLIRELIKTKNILTKN